ALPNGVGGRGLPLGMQILGRPFGEETILRVGHAYERATEWHTRRPNLVPGAAVPDVTPPPVLSEPTDRVDAETRDLCVKAAWRATRRPSRSRARVRSSGPTSDTRSPSPRRGTTALPRPGSPARPAGSTSPRSTTRCWAGRAGR